MDTNPMTAGIILLVISGGLQWIRELKKSNNNGKHLKEIKEKLDCVDEKVGETNVQLAKVKTAVNAQKTQCAATVTRFDTAISGQNKELIALAKNSGGK